MLRFRDTRRCRAVVTVACLALAACLPAACDRHAPPVPLQGSTMGSNQFRTDIPQMIQMYLDGRLMLDEMVSATISLDQVNEGYQWMKDGTVARTVITF